MPLPPNRHMLIGHKPQAHGRLGSWKGRVREPVLSCVYVATYSVVIIKNITSINCRSHVSRHCITVTRVQAPS